MSSCHIYLPQNVILSVCKMIWTIASELVAPCRESTWSINEDLSVFLWKLILNMSPFKHYKLYAFKHSSEIDIINYNRVLLSNTLHQWRKKACPQLIFDHFGELGKLPLVLQSKTYKNGLILNFSLFSMEKWHLVNTEPFFKTKLFHFRVSVTHSKPTLIHAYFKDVYMTFWKNLLHLKYNWNYCKKHITISKAKVALGIKSKDKRLCNVV